MQTLYDHGGRKFWIHNTGPLGCLPQKLSLIQLLQKKDLDTYGCISSYNAAARLFNEALLHFCQQMKSELEDATIVHVDIFSIKYDLIANSTKYGNAPFNFPAFLMLFILYNPSWFISDQMIVYYCFQNFSAYKRGKQIYLHYRGKNHFINLNYMLDFPLLNCNCT